MCVYVCMYVCMYVCIYIYIQPGAGTHTHTDIRRPPARARWRPAPPSPHHLPQYAGGGGVQRADAAPTNRAVNPQRAATTQRARAPSRGLISRLAATTDWSTHHDRPARQQHQPPTTAEPCRHNNHKSVCAPPATDSTTTLVMPSGNKCWQTQTSNADTTNCWLTEKLVGNGLRASRHGGTHLNALSCQPSGPHTHTAQTPTTAARTRRRTCRLGRVPSAAALVVCCSPHCDDLFIFSFLSVP